MSVTKFAVRGYSMYPAFRPGDILTLEPVLNPLWVFLVIGEAPGQLALAGAALVVLALTGRAWVSARNS